MSDAVATMLTSTDQPILRQGYQGAKLSRVLAAVKLVKLSRRAPHVAD